MHDRCQIDNASTLFEQDMCQEKVTQKVGGKDDIQRGIVVIIVVVSS
jgi:hypothetical protein